jgi:hypothetical protein
VIASAIAKQTSMMSTLFGNDVAVRYARRAPQLDYPTGSVLALVTWRQQDDEHWFGAKIPQSVKSVEFVFVESTADHHASYRYESYAGSPLTRVTAETSQTPRGRASYMLSQRAAVMP